MGDRRLNELLKWSLANSGPAQSNYSNATAVTLRTEPSTSSISSQPPVNGTATSAHDDSSTTATGTDIVPPPSTDALAALFGGGPSEAELMKMSMEAITSSISVSDKMVAFDNLEQLVESLDNANLLAKMELWMPLLDQLSNPDADLRRMAAWCIGTAVQNNLQCQKELLENGGLERLLVMYTGLDHNGSETKETNKETARKVVYAISSAVRNCQPAMDAAVEGMRKAGKHDGSRVDAANMDAVDEFISKMRAQVASM